MNNLLEIRAKENATIAVEKGISYETVCKATKENAKKFFNIK